MTTATVAPTWTVERGSHPKVTIVSYDLDAQDVSSSEFSAYLMLRSDAHHDNANANRKLETRHMELARERGAAILDYGDLFCAMQGKWDRRKDRSQLRPEYQTGPYLDRLVDCAVDYYEPYASQFVQLSMGNHETAIDGHHETNLTERLVAGLRERTGADIMCGTYAGYVLLRFKWRGRWRACIRVHYHHGYGGGGPVTRDVIQTARKAAYLCDADIVCSGHTHDNWVVPIAREGVTTQGAIKRHTQWHVKTGGYQDAYDSGNGWWNQRGGNPKINGSVFVRFSIEDGQNVSMAFEQVTG